MLPVARPVWRGGIARTGLCWRTGDIMRKAGTMYAGPRRRTGDQMRKAGFMAPGSMPTLAQPIGGGGMYRTGLCTRTGKTVRSTAFAASSSALGRRYSPDCAQGPSPSRISSQVHESCVLLPLLLLAVTTLLGPLGVCYSVTIVILSRPMRSVV